MTDELVQRLRELEVKATPGPWEGSGRDDCGYGWLHGLSGSRHLMHGQYREQPHDARFIAALRNALPLLLDELTRLKSSLEEQRKALRAVRGFTHEEFRAWKERHRKALSASRVEPSG